ncbi:MAG: glycoside hydrolase family 20 zincin-like fold domain-containing protein, partial [Dysgonamonadaceae bacterium]|nr:glycoside hydrolase family 20 zincin-like fold domain-containing protein [Dysgonamonadaceae bacterium]
MKCKLLIFIALLNFPSFINLESLYAQNIVWFDGKTPITYSIDLHPLSGTERGQGGEVINSALEMWKDDMRQVKGKIPQQTSAKKAKIRIIQTDTIEKKEAFHIFVEKNQIFVVGSDARGTAYGILEL